MREIELLVDLSEGFPAPTLTKSVSGCSGGGLRSKRSRIEGRLAGSRKYEHWRGRGQAFLSALEGKDEHEISTVLRDRNAKLYSHAAIAHLFGVSKATAHRWRQGVRLMAENTRPTQQERLLIKSSCPNRARSESSWRRLATQALPTVDKKYRASLSIQVSAIRTAIIPQISRPARPPSREARLQSGREKPPAGKPLLGAILPDRGRRRSRRIVR